MTPNQITDMLTESQCIVTLLKKNGDLRVMTCTKKAIEIPESAAPKGTSTRKPQDHLCSVWDVNAEGWRSFIFDNVIDITLDTKETT